MPVFRNYDVLGFGGHGKFGLQHIAVGRDHGTVLVQFKGPGPGIDFFAIHQHLKKTIAFNGQIQGVAGVLVIPLREELVHGGGPHAKAYLYAGGNGLRPVRAGYRARYTQVLVNQILKLGPAFFEARGVHVGQVVGNNVYVQLLGHHA